MQFIICFSVAPCQASCAAVPVAEAGAMRSGAARQCADQMPLTTKKYSRCSAARSGGCISSKRLVQMMWNTYFGMKRVSGNHARTLCSKESSSRKCVVKSAGQPPGPGLVTPQQCAQSDKRTALGTTAQRAFQPTVQVSVPLSNVSPVKGAVFQRAMCQRLADMDFVIFWLSVRNRCGYRLRRLAGSRESAKQ